MKKLFFSFYITLPLILIYVILIAIASFIENEHGSESARILIYDTWMFNVLHLWLFVQLACSSVPMIKAKKYASSVLHFSLCLIILGAALTRFFGIEGRMHIREGQSSHNFIYAKNYLNLEFKDRGGVVTSLSVPAPISYVKRPNFSKEFLVNDEGTDDHLKISLRNITKLNKEKNNFSAVADFEVNFKDKIYPLKLIGGHMEGMKSFISLDDGATLEASFGNKKMPLYFGLYLEKFILERYPGSRSPSSFKSIVYIMDEGKNLEENLEKNTGKKHEIYMNNTLDYKGYRFFQSSYDKDLKGTHLSVNKDPGKYPTYLGYALLIIGAFMVIFSKKGRFFFLSSFLKRQKIYLLPLLLFSLSNLPLNAADSLATIPPAQENIIKTETTKQITQKITNKTTQKVKKETAKETQEKTQKESNNNQTNNQTNNKINNKQELNKEQNDEEILKRLKLFKENTKDISEQFARLQVQDFNGRIKPLDTLAQELIHKVTKKDKFLGLSHNQILLAMTLFPYDLRSIKVIKTSNPRLKQILGLHKKESYISFNDAFHDGEYKIINYVEEASSKNPALRNNFDKDVIGVDERLNVVFSIFVASFLRIFPAKDNVWLSPIDALKLDKTNQVKDLLENFFISFESDLYSNDWTNTMNAINDIATYQEIKSEEGAPNNNIYLSQRELNLELMLNKLDIFKSLILPYILISILTFILTFIYIFKEKPYLLTLLRVVKVAVFMLFLLHLGGLILRWIVAGHAPWSNAYESMLYISFASIVAGVIFFRRSFLALAATSFLSGICLFVANLGFMDPQIGNLVPVLKSYWLNIHVSIITASYGFLGLCFILGIVSLILFIFKNEKIESVLKSLTAINEMSMILGLLMLAIGTFLGGVWANESWGRYWGWDAKETWALASVGVYAFLIHFRFIKKRNYVYAFNVLSVISFSSILMTYFGVNYYLSGLHSYASGDPIPIPAFLYYLVGGIILLICLSFFRRKIRGSI